MNTRYVQLAQLYLRQATQLMAAAERSQPGSPVRQRQEAMATQAIRKSIKHCDKAIERMGTKDVPDDDGAF